MSVVTNIIDALRRKGSGVQKSALARQDRQLRGRQVLERRRQIVSTGKGSIESFISKVVPAPETVEVLGDEDVRSIRENAALAPSLFAAFFGYEAPRLEPEQFDAVFERWITGQWKHDYAKEAIIEILGAAFGEYCVATLDMRWVKVIDTQGTVLAVEGRELEIRSYPFHVVSKRIRDGEYGFFAAVYVMIGQMAAQARPRLESSPLRC